jgi:protein O-GlcNAc transferase
VSTASQFVDAAARAARQGRQESAIGLFWQGLAAEEDPTTRRALVRVLLEAGALDEAEALIEKNVELYPQDLGLLRQTGHLLFSRQRIVAAKRYAEALIETAGRQVPILDDLAFNLLALGDGEQAIALLEECLEREPGNLRAVSNLCYACAHVPGFDAESFKSLQRSLARHFPACERPSFESWDGRRPIRIGYVSGNFHFHAVSRVVLPIIEGHDRGRVTTFVYASKIRRDARTMKARLLVDHWRSLAEVDDRDAAAIVRADGIDVLVDIDGHTGGNKLGLFSHRPAPVQISAWGYLPGPGTPGIDYLVSDQVIAPLNERAHFPERILDVACPTAIAMEDMPSPRVPADDGTVKLCVFARSAKNGSAMLRLWASILRERPQARLLLKGAFYGDPEIAGAARGILLDAGAPPEQFKVEDGQPFEVYRERLGEMDLVLDTYPYGGGLATLDALSQGTPVATWSSRHLSARTTESILRHWGLDELVAPSQEAYLPLILSLIDDQGLRRNLREKILKRRAHFGKPYFRALASWFEETAMGLRLENLRCRVKSASVKSRLSR